MVSSLWRRDASTNESKHQPILGKLIPPILLGIDDSYKTV